MQRTLVIQGIGADQLDTLNLRYLLKNSGLDGDFEVESYPLDYKGELGKKRATFTIHGNVNYSQLDAILCSKGYSIIEAITERDTKEPTLDDLLGGAK